MVSRKVTQFACSGRPCMTSNRHPESGIQLSGNSLKPSVLCGLKRTTQYSFIRMAP
jgi:hypothetical protein